MIQQRDPGDETTHEQASRLLWPPTVGPPPPMGSTDQLVAGILCLVCAKCVKVSPLGIRDDDSLPDVIKALQAAWARNLERHKTCGHA